MPESKSSIIVIDAQVGLLRIAYGAKSVITAINRGISSIREEGGIVVFAQHCHSSFQPLMKGQPSWLLHQQLDCRDEDFLIEKEASDAFYKTELDTLLKTHQVDRVVIAGLQTEFCIDTSCRAALSHGYYVTLLGDAHSTCDSHLSARDIITHHNSILGNLAHPTRSISVVDSHSLESHFLDSHSL